LVWSILIPIRVTQIGFLKFENSPQDIIENTSLTATVYYRYLRNIFDRWFLFTNYQKQS